jgi:hypothetical protein
MAAIIVQPFRASADKHLAALRQICLLPCEEQDDLDKAIKAHRKAIRR